ncbi:MFS transporter [Brucella abortus]|nr:MFS transporter [Brucella abortus]
MSHASALPLDGPAGDDILVRSQPPLIDAEADSVPAPDAQRPPSKALCILLGASLVLIAANLRPVFSSVSVLLPEIIQATGMSSVSAGVLTTLPVVCLGAFAPFAPRLAQRFGAERTLLFVLIVLTVGTAIRGLGTQSFLYMGAALAGAAIAVGNVLLPGVVKRDFPKTAAIMTGLYTMALCAGAASAAGFTIPIKNMLGCSGCAGLCALAAAGAARQAPCGPFRFQGCRPLARQACLAGHAFHGTAIVHRLYRVWMAGADPA